MTKPYLNIRLIYPNILLYNNMRFSRILSIAALVIPLTVNPTYAQEQPSPQVQEILKRYKKSILYYAHFAYGTIMGSLHDDELCEFNMQNSALTDCKNIPEGTRVLTPRLETLVCMQDAKEGKVCEVPEKDREMVNALDSETRQCFDSYYNATKRRDPTIPTDTIALSAIALRHHYDDKSITREQYERACREGIDTAVFSPPPDCYTTMRGGEFEYTEMWGCR